MTTPRLALLTFLVALLPATAWAQSSIRAGGGSGAALTERVAVASRSADDATVVLGAQGGSIRCTDNAVGFALRPRGQGQLKIPGRMRRFTLDGCSDTIPVIDITACRLASPLPAIRMWSTGPQGGVVALGQTYFRCDVARSELGCYFNSSSLVPPFANSGAQLALGTGLLTQGAPPGAADDLGVVCGPPAGANLSGRFTDLVVGGRSQATLSLTPVL
jgi:hypothetical protein